MELLVEPRLEAQPLAHGVGGRDRQDRRGEERRIEEPGREQQVRVLAGQRSQRLRGVGGARDVGDAGRMQRGRARHDDEPGDDRREQAADDDVPARGAVLPDGDALLDDRRLQVELHPRRDRRADQADQHVDVAVVVDDVGPLGAGHHRERRGTPVWMCQHAGHDVADVEAGRDKEDLLDAVVGALHDQQPHHGRGQRHDNVAGDAEQFEAARHAGELGHHVAEVGDDQGKHQPERDAEAELLANEIAQPLAGHGAHAGRHLLHDDEGNGRRDHRPQQRVAELGACDGVGPDAAGIVVDVRGDEARADDGQEQYDPRAPLLEEGFHVSRSAAWKSRRRP